MSKKRRVVQEAKSRKATYWRCLRGFGLMVPTASGLTLASAPAALALELYNGNEHGNNLEISLNITTSYSGFYRVGSPAAVLLSGKTNANGNDGDTNFQHGLVGNSFEVLPVLDIKDGTFGMHFSGEYFINTVYLQTNQNNEAATVNPIVSKNTDFASETRQANGETGQMLDAFIYNNWEFDDGQSVALKAGKQTLFWGQSLFFGTNGIAGGQAPVDVIAAQNLVNPQSQQVFLPVGQIVATYQPNDVYTLQAYYQFQWEPSNLQGVGSFFSTSDVTGPGNNRIVAVAGTTNTNGYYFYNTKALTPPSQNGQFGASIQASYGNYDVGLFGLRYDSKTPTVYETVGPVTAAGLANPDGPQIGTFKLVYPRDIWLGGTSLSTTIGATNVAGELSGRAHMNLVGSAAPIRSGNQGNASNDPLYPVGDTMTGLASFIYGSPSIPFDPGGVTIDGEVEYVRVLSVTANEAQLAPGRSSSAAAFDIQATPAYYEVLPDLDLQFPISIKYNFAGNSEMDSTMNHGTGTYSFGITTIYRKSWNASLAYVGLFGNVGANPLAPNVQPSDRTYVTLNLQHTF